MFPIIYRYDLKGLEKYLDDGGDIEVCDSEWESTPVEHVHTACSFAGEEYFSHFEKLFDLLYDRGAKIERPGENFFFRVLIAADDDPFYDKLKSMKLKPSAETLNNALDVLLNFEERPDHAERIKKDFG